MAKIKRESFNSKRKLIGWLVAYDDDNLGEYYELRTGRYIIKNNLLPAQEGDIIVNKSGIDSPHLAINVTNDFKVAVQDIFSREGVFYTRMTEDIEKRLSGTILLKHGDKIRLGKNKNFQVCLLNE